LKGDQIVVSLLRFYQDTRTVLALG